MIWRIQKRPVDQLRVRLLPVEYSSISSVRVPDVSESFVMRGRDLCRVRIRTLVVIVVFDFDGTGVLGMIIVIAELHQLALGLVI